MTRMTRMTRSTLAALVLITCLAAAAFGLQLGGVRGSLTSPSNYVRLPATFSYWDAAPITRHLGLAFDSDDDVAKGRAYQHMAPGWLALAYGVMKPLRWAGVSYATGQNAIVFVTFAVMVLMVSAAVLTSGREGATGDVASAASWLVLVLLGFGVVATLPSLWVAAIVGNPEAHDRFLATVGVAFISVLDFQGRPIGRAGFFVAVAIALIAPMYAACLVIALACLGMSLRRSEWLILAGLTTVGIAGPYVMLWIGGWQGVGSSLFYRSGLNGDVTYFSSMLQAVFQPFDDGGRAWRLLPLITVAPAAALAAFAWSRPVGERMLRQLLFCWSPALLWIVAFPQAVSIHPYIFDFGLLFPAAFCLAFWVTQAEAQRLFTERRALAFAVFIVMAGLLMTNLIDLARS
jgi:hypothetical protein